MCCFYEAKTIRINKANLKREPTEPIDAELIRESHADQTCPVCFGKGFLQCAACEEGRVPFLGGLQECSQCAGTGVKSCPVCKGRGEISLK